MSILDIDDFSASQATFVALCALVNSKYCDPDNSIFMKVFVLKPISLALLNLITFLYFKKINIIILRRFG